MLRLAIPRNAFNKLKRLASSCTDAVGCCQANNKRPIPSPKRPDLDFDYLLDNDNKDAIQQNIMLRKGVGDIEKLHDIWTQIQIYGDRTEKSVDEFQELWDQLYLEALHIPNRTHRHVPVVVDDNCLVVEEFGCKRGNRGLHIAEDLVKGWKSVLYPRSSSGNRAYTFLGSVAKVEQALLAYGLNVAMQMKPDFCLIDVDDVLPMSTTQACGFLPKSADNHNLQYLLEDDRTLCLSGTAEMGIAHTLIDKVFDSGTHWFLAKSRCYRPEVSNVASEAKLYRVHEFTKVEMFVVCDQDQSDRVLDELVAIQKEVFSRLGLHCRVLDMPSHELGASAARKFDIEAWMPGRNQFGEVSSASNCLDYQARRLNIKMKGDQGTRFAHTCNGTCISSTRATIAVLETHQGERKSWQCPEVLKPYMGSGRHAGVIVKQATKFKY